MFLHFGELHLIFNMLWLWYFGKQLEAIQPVWVFLLLVILTSFVSNTAQYMQIGYSNFGGMSGVVYGLVGYTWIIHTFMPRSHLMLNSNMFIVFLLALVLMEIIASSWVATAAHVGGLVSGLLFGMVAVLYYRLILKRPVIGNR
jgi:GlpG protein